MHSGNGESMLGQHCKPARRFLCLGFFFDTSPNSCAFQFARLWNITGTKIHTARSGGEPWAQGSMIPGSNYSAQVKYEFIAAHQQLQDRPSDHIPVMAS